MAHKNLHHLSDDFIQLLFKSTHGYFTPEQLDKLIELFESEMLRHYFTKSSESNLFRIFGAILDKTFFLNECIKYPHHAEIIVAIAANSNYLTDIVVRNPEYLYMLFNNKNLAIENNQKKLSNEIKEKLAGFNSLNGKLNYLRLLKRREFLRIGTNDILANWQLDKVVNQLSVLANSILENLFTLCLRETCERFGIEKYIGKYCLLSLGKLGGNELNYSSDVDLMVIYGKDVTIRGQHAIDILTHTIKLFSQSASEITHTGYIYRVDFRLRPDGKTAPLATTLLDSMNYYETRGEDWERQMLTKLNLVCGSTSLYEKFRSFVTGYVYGASFKSSPQETVLRMKRNIEMNSSSMNIKTFEGGIRDIEFSVQALQILNGKRNENLQSPSTLFVLNELNKLKLLNNKEYRTFLDSYILYRKIEHWLQLMNDKQTHTIPENELLINQLSRYLDYNTASDFKNELEKSKKSVRKIYNSIVGIKPEQKKSQIDISQIKFSDLNRAQKNIEYLQSGKSLVKQKQFDAKTISLFDSILSDLLQYLTNAANHDLVLENFVKIIHNVKFVDIWYKEFSNKKFFRQFLDIMQFSQFSVDLLSLNHELKDFVISRKVFTKNLQAKFDNYSFDQIKLALAVQFTLGLISWEKVSQVYSSFIAYRISELAEEKKFGYKYFLAGLGSFGSNEITFFSDIDLIVVVNNITTAPGSHSDFHELLNEIHGALPGVEIDFRLRPEGKSSPLVWDMENYEKYLDERADVWEFQALLKLQFLCGDKKPYNSFKRLLINRLKELKGDHLKKSIKEMHEKTVSPAGSSTLNIKKSRGGLVTIQYIIQYLVLLQKDLIGNSIGKSTVQLIKKLSTFSSDKQFNELKNDYSFLKNCELWFQNMFNQRSANIPTGEKKLRMMSKALKISSETEIVSRINNAIKNGSINYKKYLE